MATKHKSDVKSPTYAPLHKAGVSSHNAQLTNCREESATQKKAAPTVRQEADIQGQNHRNTVIYGIMKTESYLHPKKCIILTSTLLYTRLKTTQLPSDMCF